MRGSIKWFVNNSVAANLIMWFLVIGGILTISTIPQEIFPELTTDIVSISAVYPGAAPAEVEQGVLLPIEEKLESIDGIDRMISRGYEGVGTVTLELIRGTDLRKTLDDVKSQVGFNYSFLTRCRRSNCY